MSIPFPERSPLKRRRARIVATIGPASNDPQILIDLIEAGVCIFRLNMSHGDHETHRLNFERVREAARKTREPIAILADLCGPKIRVGQFENGSIELKHNEKVVVTTREVTGRQGVIPSLYHDLANDVKSGDRILLNDGLLELYVVSVEGTEINCTVVHGGVLKDRKGMNLPGVDVSAATLTEKDREDATFMVGLGVDLFALSFVRRPEDVLDLKELIEEKGAATPVIAKIEKPEALQALDDIIKVSDGIMVARGDLGVEMPPETVPFIQQKLVTHAREKGKPVIVATQMLESMVEHPTPTRAEVSDVSTAVFSGADGIMLSAETSVGAYPLRAVQMMDRVARQAEGWLWSEGAFHSLTGKELEITYPMPWREAIARSTAQLSRDLRVRSIVARTRNGDSATVIAATRPAAPIVALCTDEALCRQMNLLWGVIPRLVDEADLDQPQGVARRLVKELELAKKDDYILMISGFGGEEPTIAIVTV